MRGTPVNDNLSRSEPRDSSRVDASWRMHGKVYRAKLIMTDEEENGTGFVLNPKIDIEDYYALSERILAQFLRVSQQEKMLQAEHYYKTGHRLLKFWTKSLPGHISYNEGQPRLQELKRKSREHIVLMTSSLEELSLTIDQDRFKEHLLKQKEERKGEETKISEPRKKQAVTQPYKSPRALKRIDNTHNSNTQLALARIVNKAINLKAEGKTNTRLKKKDAAYPSVENQIEKTRSIRGTVKTESLGDNGAALEAYTFYDQSQDTANSPFTFENEETSTLSSAQTFSSRFDEGHSETTDSLAGIIASLTKKDDDFFFAKSNIHLLECEDDFFAVNNRSSFEQGKSASKSASSLLSRQEQVHRDLVKKALFPDISNYPLTTPTNSREQRARGSDAKSTPSPMMYTAEDWTPSNMKTPAQFSPALGSGVGSGTEKSIYFSEWQPESLTTKNSATSSNGYGSEYADYLIEKPKRGGKKSFRNLKKIMGRCIGEL